MNSIGNLNDVCPYCSSKLNRRPQKKKKCAQCGNYIYVRTRPTDRKRVLVTEKQIEEIEDQWSKLLMARAPRIQKQEVFDDAKKILAAKFGREPADSDVIWSLLKKEIITYTSSHQWGLYRNTLFEMGELLRSKNKWSCALDRYLEVCYLDLNGGSNYGDLRNIRTESLLDTNGRQIKEFDPERGELVSGVLQRIDQILEHFVDLNRAELREKFLNVTARREKSLKLPMRGEDGSNC
jgi:hypothetical protein